ncbi:hypothetical protein DEU56DRAFT_760694 [Suillus clintonianus]|uniref:uncharacterized protein n=1 Tax=Suillus clintonianus TaxID=1904413 RepID=UPI001B864701|nr:uncharacterized protein DEU56DRAFT_760694 [Suillus clintonianus]KAG2121449.1 hypothetical protein DEU56DRAFT_760694 [Suillus clintonianus]
MSFVILNPHCVYRFTLENAVNININPTDVQSAQVVDVEAVSRIIFPVFPCVYVFYHEYMDSSPLDAWPDVERRLLHLKSSADLCSRYTHIAINTELQQATTVCPVIKIDI